MDNPLKSYSDQELGATVIACFDELSSRSSMPIGIEVLIFATVTIEKHMLTCKGCTGCLQMLPAILSELQESLDKLKEAADNAEPLDKILKRMVEAETVPDGPDLDTVDAFLDNVVGHHETQDEPPVI